jgi:large subunit ribosomal protein L17
MFTNRKKQKLQGKRPAHKRSIIKSQIIELVRNDKLKTTPKKAKVVKSEFDKLVTKYKLNTNASKKNVMSFFSENKRAFDRFSSVVDSKLQDRNSGYTRIIKTLPRKGDNAEQAFLMLVNTEATEKKSKIKELLEKRDGKKQDDKKEKVTAKVVSDSKKSSTKVVNKEKTAKTRRNSK